MALIDARKRMDVTGLDISEQPGSKYILMYNDLPFAIDEWTVNGNGTLQAFVGASLVVAFNARRASWIVLDRSVAKLATKEELAAAAADLQKLQEEVFAKHHPDEYRAYQQQRTRALGLGNGGGREPGNYL